MRRPRPALRLLALWLLLPGAAGAADFTAGGLTFSDALGGFRLTGVSGSGSAADPFVVREQVTGPGAAVLQIVGLGAATPESGLSAGALALEKVVTNATAYSWTSFELELRESLDQPSGYLDGLSFGQLVRDRRTIGSDRLPQLLLRDEPYDSIVFSGGLVAPGESVTFRLTITDVTPVSPFYLLQRLQIDVVEAGSRPKTARQTP